MDYLFVNSRIMNIKNIIFNPCVLKNNLNGNNTFFLN